MHVKNLDQYGNHSDGTRQLGGDCPWLYKEEEWIRIPRKKKEFTEVTKNDFS